MYASVAFFFFFWLNILLNSNTSFFRHKFTEDNLYHILYSPLLTCRTNRKRKKEININVLVKKSFYLIEYSFRQYSFVHKGLQFKNNHIHHYFLTLHTNTQQQSDVKDCYRRLFHFSFTRAENATENCIDLVCHLSFSSWHAAFEWKLKRI